MALVLLVEDDTLLRDSLRIALQDAGHTVLPAANGAAALLVLDTSIPDIVVSDILMPETDGLELIMRIRKTRPDVKIIAISGGGRTRNMDMLSYAREFGAHATLAKPFLPRQLLSAIEDVMRMPAS
jgi:DNA-binding response OmpR family regulator